MLTPYSAETVEAVLFSVINSVTAFCFISLDKYTDDFIVVLPIFYSCKLLEIQKERSPLLGYPKSFTVFAMQFP